MNKALMSMALAMAPMALAQAADVTMYGIIDANVQMIDLGANSRNALMVGNGMMSNSRWGVRGSEDLGGGLKAIFQLEAGFYPDVGTNDASFFQRTAQVGLSGGFGTIKLGRGYTPAFLMNGSWDVQRYGMFNSILTATIPHSIGGADTATTRFSNGIFYNSPSFAGVSVNLAYQAGESTADADPSSAGQGMDIAVGYKAGPLNLGVYYQQTKNASAISTKRTGTGGGYDFGGFRLTASHAQSKQDGFEKYSATSLGAMVKVGSGGIYSQLIRLADDNAADADALAFGLGYVHHMSKRTDLYAVLGTTRNKSNGNFSMRAGVETFIPDAPGSDPRGISFGMRHIF